MRCEVHCPDGGDALAGAVAVAVLVAGFAVAVSVAAAVVASLAEAAALAVLAVCVVLLWPTWRLMRYGDRREVFRRHRRPVVARVALTRGPLPLEAPKPAVQGIVISKAAERIVR